MITADPEITRRELAADWCARLVEGLDTIEDQAGLEAWLASDPLNRSEFERMAALWEGADLVADSPDLIFVRADALEAFRSANHKRWSRRILSRWPGAAALAACLLLLVVAAGLYYRQTSPILYVTGIGERRVVNLDDGSRISLDAATKVEVALSGERRALTLLAGRAKFDVAKDPRRPFTVLAGTRVVVATGTSFSVELLRRQVQVILYEGNIAVLEDGPADRPARHVGLSTRRVAADQIIEPGSMMLASLDLPVATIAPVDPVQTLSWQGGQITFADEPLAIAAERVNRYSSLRIVVRGGAADIPVSGVFNAGDTESFVDGIRSLYHLSMVREGNTIVLSEGGRES